VLSKCLNPHCEAPFRYMRDGQVFHVLTATAEQAGENASRQTVEHYWLCGRCSMSLKVVVENGIVTLVRRDASAAGDVENGAIGRAAYSSAH